KAFARRLVARRNHGEPRKGVRILAGGEALKRSVEPFRGLRELRGKSLRDFRADFIAARANRRPERGDYVWGLGPELKAHSAERFGDDPRQRAAPTRMF